MATLHTLLYDMDDFVLSVVSVILSGRVFDDLIRPTECGSEVFLNWTSR